MIISRRARLMKKSLGSVVTGTDKSLEERRAAMNRVDRLPRPRKVDYVETTIGGVPAIVATPTGVDPDRHILYFHGGGYTMGSPRSHIAMCARLAKRSAATITVIDYRLAPENVYPAAIDDCVAAYRALATEVDPALITIAGDSAGGGASIATLCALRDAGDALPGCTYVLSPWTDLTGSGETILSMAEVDPMITLNLLEEAGRMYAGELALDDPRVSPLFANLAGLPPMLIQTGMDEILLSDSTRLAEMARDAGVEVQLDLRDGLWHVYPGFAGLMPEATDALVRAAVFIRARTPALVDA